MTSEPWMRPERQRSADYTFRQQEERERERKSQKDREARIKEINGMR